MAQPQNPIDIIRAEVNRMLDGLDDAAPIAATVAFKVKSDKVRVFERNINELTIATRKLAGLVRFVSHRRMAGGPEYLIYEEWQTVKYFRSQWNSGHLKKFQYSVLNLVAAPPDLKFYRGSDTANIPPAPVFRTGQARCWDENGVPLACGRSGMDGAVQAGIPSPIPRFTDNGDGTVTDRLTNLIWLRDANHFNERPWEEALQICNALASGRVGLTDGSKAGDWRLPNVNEVQSLLHLDSTTGAAVEDGNPFINLEAANYWTSTSVALAPPLGWFVALSVGPPVFDLKVNAMRVWPVRGENSRVARTGQTKCYNAMGQEIPCCGTGQDGAKLAGVPFPSPRFTDNQDGTVKDNLTGLIWLKNAHLFGVKPWGHAVDACNDLADGRHKLPNGKGEFTLSDGSLSGDWRLPNLKELRSIIDYDHFVPALPPAHPFEDVRTSLYWSSTTVASAPNQARFVFVGIGPSVWDHKSVELGVWPVRGGVI